MKPTWSADDEAEREATVWLANIIGVIAKMGSRAEQVSWPLMIFPSGRHLFCGPEEFSSDLIASARELAAEDDEFVFVADGTVLNKDGATNGFGLFHFDRDDGLLESWGIILDVQEVSVCENGHRTETVRVTTQPIFRDRELDKLAEAVFL